MPRKKTETQESDKIKTNAKTPPKKTIKEVEGRWTKFIKHNFGMSSTNNFLVNTGSMFTNDPYLLNQRIKQLKTSPNFLSRDKIEEALINPENNELPLRTATRSMIYSTYPLYRLMMLYEGLLTYHSYIRPVYVNKDEMGSERFKSDWKFVDMWEKKLNPQKQFRRIVAEVLPEGKRAYYIRQNYNTTSGKEKIDYVHFQDLPSDWYKIIKHSTESYAVVAFNFAYFWQAGTSLDQFPPIFTKYYQELMSATEVLPNGNKLINPEKIPDDVVIEYNNETTSWFYWKELPSDECFMFSFTESDDLQISPFCSLILQAQDLASYSLLQQQLLTVPLYSMLLGEIPMNENNKSGSHIDDMTLSPDAVTLFEGKVNNSMPPGTTYTMVPSKNNSLHHFQEVPNANKVYNMGLQQMINTFGTSTLMTTTEKPSVAQVNAGKTIESRYIDRIYEQFKNSVNIILNKMYGVGDLKFKWEFDIFGDCFSDKDRRKAVEDSLTLGQLEFLPKYLAYENMSLMDAVTTSEWVESSGIYSKFKPFITSFTQSSKDVGREKKNEDEIDNDNTAASIDSGQNTGDMKNYSLKFVCPECGKPSCEEGFPYCSECSETDHVEGE